MTTSTYIVTTRASKRAAEAYITRHANMLGETLHWTGREHVPATLVWEAVKNEEGRWDVRGTHTIKENQS